MDDPEAPQGLSQQRKVLFLLLGLTALLYLPSLFAGFVFDDHYLIEQNTSLHSFHGLVEAFTQDYYGQANPQYALGYYRPLSLLTHWLDWQIWGSNPAGHHLTNLLLHLACVAVLFLLIHALFGNQHLALLASTVFAVHPSHAGSVTFISGRVDVLATCLALMSLLLFLKRRAATAPAYLAALLSKEISVTVPALAFWSEREKGWRAAMRSMIPFLAVLFCVLFLRYLILGPPRAGAFAFSFQNLITAARSLPAYMRFLVLPPFQLFLEPSPDQLPMALNLAALGLFGAALWLLHDRRLAGWSLAWLITLAPVLGIVHLETSLDERFLYFPSIAFCLPAGGLVLRYLKSRTDAKEPADKHVMIAALIISAVYAPSLMVRQAYWQNDLSLWSSAVETDSGSARTRLRYGVALMEAGDLKEAEEQFRLGLSLPQESSMYTAALYTHTATVRQMEGSANGVEDLYRKALHLEPGYFTAHFNLALYYKNRGNADDAILQFQEALRSNPKSVAAHSNLAGLLKQKGRDAEAEEHERLARELGLGR